jgi:selenocysteine lyase/cysteine desulfurase
MPGHKGLMGPQGTGMLLCRDSGQPVLFGGTGSASASQDMPPFLPDRLEAGTHNVSGIAGLLAGIEAVRKVGPAEILRHEQRLTRRMGEQLTGIPGLRVFLSPTPSAQAGVLSVAPGTCSCEALAESLGERGVAVRSGLHCAPCAHETAGTLKAGTLRFSFSLFTTESEVRRAAALTERIMKKV